jgi:gliding motility-associated-like protein
MIATSDHGCSDTTTTNAIVLRDPKPDFLPDYRQGCVPLTVNFTNLSTSYDDSIVSWNWTYSDGGTDTSSTPEHTFSQTGLYSVNLHAVTQRGCVSDTFMTNLIDVHPLPVANFEYSPQPADIIIPSINFTDMSGPVSRWYWNFGDSTLSNDKDPIHIYEEAGTYNVQLIVENEFGCPDTTYRIIVIDDAYTLWVPNAFTPNGDGRNDEFMIKSTGITDIRMEIFSRWGREIFHSNSLYTGWDGRMDGGQAVEDTYVYRIVAKDRQQKEHIVVGHVTLYY